MATIETEVSKQLEEIKVMVKAVYELVVGNEHEKENGLLERVKELETQSATFKKYIDRLTFTAIGMGFPASWGLIDIIQKVVLKVSE